METQLQRYNGKNYHNNEVKVDFDKKNVEFRKVEPENHQLSLWRGYDLFSSMIKRTVRLFFTHYLIWIFYQDYMSGWQKKDQFILVLLIGAVCYFGITRLVALIFFNKKFRENYYPKVNTYLIMACNILKFKRPMKKHTFVAKRLGDLYEIPDFDNIYLKYKATGDVAKQLKKIVILSESKYDTGKWRLFFLFRRYVRDGELEVSYI